MCVIAYGYKHHFLKEWFEQCCKRNPDGFFVTRVNTGEFVRTLKYEEALDFYDKSKDNDAIVLHARIKSVGPINANNVHGWRAAGMQFCHNGTLHLKITDDRTDSETMFRDVIVPLFKANKRRLTPKLTRTIEALASGSRFLIIHKKLVYLFGGFEEKGGCYFSNLYWVPSPVSYTPSSYTPFGSYGKTYSKYSKYSKYSPSNYKYDSYDPYDDYDDFDYWGNYRTKTKTKTKTKTSTGTDRPTLGIIPGVSEPRDTTLIHPSDILPSHVLLKFFIKNYKEQITPEVLANVFPAHSWIRTARGASPYSLTAVKQFLRKQNVPENDINSTMATLSKGISAERTAAVSDSELRSWLFCYARFILRVMRQLLTPEAYINVSSLLCYYARYYNSAVPKERLADMLTDLPKSLHDTLYTPKGELAPIRPTTTLVRQGVSETTVFYALYNLHLMANQIQTVSGTFNYDLQLQYIPSPTTRWLEYYKREPLIQDLFYSPDLSSDHLFLSCLCDTPDEIYDTNAAVAIPAIEGILTQASRGLILRQVTEALAPTTFPGLTEQTKK